MTDSTFFIVMNTWVFGIALLLGILIYTHFKHEKRIKALNETAQYFRKLTAELDKEIFEKLKEENNKNEVGQEHSYIYPDSC